MKIKNLLIDLYWWFQYRLNPNHQYHIVKTNLTPGYYDPNERLFHSAFAVLIDYVENCQPDYYFDEDDHKNYYKHLSKGDYGIEIIKDRMIFQYQKAGDMICAEYAQYVNDVLTIIDLYNWYKFQRNNRGKKVFDDFNKFNNEMIEKYGRESLFNTKVLTIEEKSKRQQLLNLVIHFEIINDIEDKMMMIKLCNVMHYLTT